MSAHRSSSPGDTPGGRMPGSVSPRHLSHLEGRVAERPASVPLLSEDRFEWNPTVL